MHSSTICLFVHIDASIFNNELCIHIDWCNWLNTTYILLIKTTNNCNKIVLLIFVKMRLTWMKQIIGKRILLSTSSIPIVMTNLQLSNNFCTIFSLDWFYSNNNNKSWKKVVIFDEIFIAIAYNLIEE